MPMYRPCTGFWPDPNIPVKFGADAVSGGGGFGAMAAGCKAFNAATAAGLLDDSPLEFVLAF